MTVTTHLYTCLSISALILALTSEAADAGKLRDLGSSTSSSSSSRSSSSSNRSSSQSRSSAPRSAPSPSSNSRSGGGKFRDLGTSVTGNDNQRNKARTRRPASDSPSPENSTRSRGGKLRDLGRKVNGGDTPRDPPSPPPGGSSNNSHGWPWWHHYPRHGGYFSRYYCRRPSLFEHLYFDNYYASRCIVPRTHVVRQQTETSTPEDGIEISEENAETKLPYESLRSSRMLEPTIRADLSLGEADSSLDMRDFRLEAGFSFVSVSWQHNSLTEDFVEDGVSVTDKLTVDKLMLNFRMRLAEQFAFQVGIGSYNVQLKSVPEASFDMSATAIQFAGKWHSPNGFGIEYLHAAPLRNKFSSNETEISLFHGYESYSLRAGYRLFQFEGVSFNGPFLGISAHF